MLDPGSSALVAATFVLTIPLIAAATYPTYAIMKLTATDRSAAAVYIALPSMLLDVLSLSFFETIFPNLFVLSTSAAAVFGTWLLWAYSLILVTGLFPNSLYKGRRSSQ